MTFSGTLDGIHLADVFQNLHTNRQTGVLRVAGRGFEHFVRFQDGMIAGYSLGVGVGLPLAEFLVGRGYVERTALDALLKKRARSRKPLRTLLAAARLLDEPGFKQACSTLIQERLYELVTVSEAQFDFGSGDAPPRVFDAEQSTAGIALDPGPILMEAARRKDELARIRNVVTGDNDLFVLLEGADEFEMEPVMAETAALLDGRTPVHVLLAALPHDPFVIKKAISDLVLQGLARPLLVQEMEELATEAITEGRRADAIACLTRALQSERNHRGLREQLAELLALDGRTADAAAEYAAIAYDLAKGGDLHGALTLYDHATILAPRDLPLLERRANLLAELGDLERHLEAVFALVDLMCEMGLAERARQALQGARARLALRHRIDLAVRLAEVEMVLGHRHEAADLFLEAGERIVETDRRQALALLARAVECHPEDELLERRFLELESGERERRRIRTRRRMGLAALVVSVLAVVAGGVVELTASHAVLHVVEDGLQELTRGRTAETVARLQDVGRRYPWSPAGRRTRGLVDGLVAASVDVVEQQLALRQWQQALNDVTALKDVVDSHTQVAQLSALERRIHAEQAADALLERACHTLTPDQTTLDAVAGLTQPELLDFLVHCLFDAERRARIPPRVRAALLDALAVIDSPRAFPAVARLHVANREPAVSERTRRLLATAVRHREAGREGEWRHIYPELEQALQRSETRAAADEALLALRGH